MSKAGLDLSRKKVDVCLLSDEGEHLDQLESSPAQRRGWSIVTHAQNLTGKEKRDRIDEWINALQPPPPEPVGIGAADDVPF